MIIEVEYRGIHEETDLQNSLTKKKLSFVSAFENLELSDGRKISFSYDLIALILSYVSGNWNFWRQFIHLIKPSTEEKPSINPTSVKAPTRESSSVQSDKKTEKESTAATTTATNSLVRPLIFTTRTVQGEESSSSVTLDPSSQSVSGSLGLAV